MKIYIGGPMFCESDIQYNNHLKQLLLSHGFAVYCPNENKQINDKTRTDITSERIYRADINELLNCNVFLCKIALDCGTMWEAGFMDCLSQNVNPKKYYGCIGLTTDIRLNTIPNPSKRGIDNQSMYIDQFIIGGLKLSLGVYTSEDMLIKALDKIKIDKGEK
jgi:hypothetical protein